jgi:hypothetical protein
MLDPVFRPPPDAEFTDLEGDPAEDVIQGLARLGVFGYGGFPFNPDAGAQRGEYVTWLVRAYMIFWRDTPSRWLKLASEEEGKIFMDVPPREHCFPYVQGMINAGHPVGFEEREFHYQRDITREHLIFVRNSLLLGAEKVLGDPALLDDYRVRLKLFLDDADAITEEYLPAIAADLAEGDTIELAFNHTETLCPRKVATRREACLSLSELHGRTLDQALNDVLPKWVPLPESERQRLQEEEAKKHEHEHSHSH